MKKYLKEKKFDALDKDTKKMLSEVIWDFRLGHEKFRLAKKIKRGPYKSTLIHRDVNGTGRVYAPFLLENFLFYFIIICIWIKSCKPCM